jgi:hypothetical protein
MTDLWSTRPAVGEATNVGSESTRRFDIGPADRRNRPVPANAASDGRRQELPRYQPLMAGLNLIEHQDSSAYIPVVWDKTIHAYRVHPLPRHRGRR